MTPITKHAPPERASWDELHYQLTTVNANTALQGTIDKATESILLLNRHRQIVYANAASRTLLCKNDDPAKLYGCRPGEALCCVHAHTGVGGCGTSQACRVCGAVNAVLKSLSGTFDVQRCSIQSENRDAPFKCIIFAMPVQLDGESYSLVALKDASEASGTNALAKHAFAMRGLASLVEQSGA
ncbi:MAG: hypothetical protein ACPGKS_03255 [Coraliomargarita sp.]